jgi:5-methylthioadenosine/S-adenosylhomocysteine deaminase
MIKQIILKNAKILTLNAKDEILDGTDIKIENDTITQIGKNIMPQSNEEVIDCTDLALMPGLVNAHLHSDENMFRGKYDNMPLELWMLYAYPPSPKYGGFKDRLVYLRTLIGAIEQIHSGVTSCQDDVSGHPVTTPETHDIIFKAYEDIGMRANVSTSELHKNYLDTIPYLRDIMPKEIQEKFTEPRSIEKSIDSTCEIIEKWNNKGNMKVTLSPIAPQRCDDEYNKAIFDIAVKYDLPYHTHVCETRMQRETGYKMYGKTILQHCADIGILEPRTTIAHGNWLDDDDIMVAKDTGINVVHNIVSNLKLGSGIMPYAKMKKAGIHLALGTDGTSSNDSQNLLEVMKAAALVHKVTQPDYSIWPTSGDIINMATKGGARSLMRENEIGSLEEGKKADIIMFDMNSVAFTPLNDIKNQLVYCENGSSLVHVMIAGKFVMKDKKIATVNENEIIHELRRMQKDFLDEYEKTLPFSDLVYKYVEQSYWKCMNDNDDLWRLSGTKKEYANIYEEHREG